MLSEWTYRGRAFDDPIDDYEGFVYLITNSSSGRKYIGKKSFWTRQKDPKKGRRVTRESDWQRYHGSSDELKEDVRDSPNTMFYREILHLCYYKKQMSFLEEKEQWNSNVLLGDGYYNTNIAGRYFAKERHIYLFDSEHAAARKGAKKRRPR